MGAAIGQMLPLAVGVAVSPLPIVAVVLMLVTERGWANGPAFVAGWIIGLAVVGVIVLSLAGAGGASEDGQPAEWVNWLKLLLGSGLLLLAIRQWRGKPGRGEEPPAPKWMGALDRFSPVKAAGAGVALSGLNPKNLLLTIAAGAAIAQTGITAGEEAVVYAIFVLIATVGVGTPVVLYFALGDRSRHLLEELKTWMIHNNAAVMSVLMLLIGVKVIGDAITGFSG